MKLHRYVAGLFGYELVKTRKLNDTLEQHLSNVIAECGINLVVDVGASDIEVETLVDVWPDVTHCLTVPRALLKLDTQGHDLMVLAGGKDIMSDVQAIQVEISLKPIYDGAPHYLDALVEFETAGFEITGMYPVSRDKKSLAIIEYDCVMTRRQSE